MSFFKTARWSRWRQTLATAHLHAQQQGLGGVGTFFLSRDRSIGARIEVGQRQLLNFSSYDYLGLTQHPEVLAASHEAIDRYGSSSSASRVVAGQTAAHDALDARIARFLGTESAMSFNSGFGTNASTIGFLFEPRDLVIHDSLMHQSGLEGIRLSGAKRIGFKHNDMASLEAVLRAQAHQHREVLVLVEGAYSMDGDACPLREIVALKQKYGFRLMVDEAHSLGTLGATGRGIAEHTGVNRADVDVWMGTLSKSLASCGGYIAGDADLIDYLCSNCPAYVYSVALAPASAAAAHAALSVIEREPQRVHLLQTRVKQAQRIATGLGLDIGTCDEAPILPVIVRESDAAVGASFSLFRRNVCAHPLLYPSVPKNGARLRFFITALHTEAELREALTAVVSVMEEQKAAAQPVEGRDPLREDLRQAAAALRALSGEVPVSIEHEAAPTRTSTSRDEETATDAV
jgi:8-amino-7-oxononanoate synthase